MLQQGTGVTWDFNQIGYASYVPVRLFVLYLFATCVMALTKLVRTWVALPPLAKPSVDRLQSALPMLERTAVSLRRWLVLTVLAWGMATSFTIVSFCQRMLTWEVSLRWLITLSHVAQLSVTLTFALVVIAFLYVIRWYLLNRIERFRK
jgi:hypothetical protein